MTLDEILDGYEEVWRQAALDDAKQFSVNMSASGPYRACAWLIAGKVGDEALENAAWLHTVMWRGQKKNLHSVMIHLNNEEKWDWLRFANKFRDEVTWTA